MAKVSNKKIVQKTKADVYTNRVMALIIAAFVGAVFLTLMNNAVMQSAKVEEYRYELYKYVLTSGVLVVLSLGYLIFVKVKKIDESMRTLTGFNIFLTCLVAFLFAFRIYYSPVETIRFAYIFLAVICGLYLILRIYQKEFFAMGLCGAVCGILFWVAYKAGSAGFSNEFFMRPMIGAVVAVALYLIFVVFMNIKGGKIKIKGKEIEVFMSNTGFILGYLFAAVCLGIIISIFIFGTTIAYYGVFGIAIALFAGAVYYTVKLAK